MPDFEASLIATSDSELAAAFSELLGGSAVVAPSFRIALAQIRTAQPHNILIDSQLDGGDAISLGLVIQRHCPLAISVLLHQHTRWVSQEAALALGFNYLLDRNLDSHELVKHLTKALSQPRQSEKSLLDSLSRREQEIFSHLEQGLRNVEIAEHFEISLATIKTHVSSIYRKLGVRNRVEAIAKVRS
jgi:DNA-binding NarL/FixJ family response regulator